VTSARRCASGTHKGIFDTPKDLGQATVKQPASIGGATKVCEHWRWTETILKVLPMSTTNFYVDMAAAGGPAPFASAQVIKPLNKPLGTENASYVGYAPTDVSDYFDIDPDSVAKCQKSDKCQDNDALRQLNPNVAALLRHAPTAYDKAKALASSAAARSPSPPAPNVTFATDYTSHEDGVLLIAQGATTGPTGDPCCAANAPNPQCQVQLQHYAGQRFFDLTNQRSRFEDVVGNQVVVDDYSKHMSMVINSTNGVDTCQEFCPIDPDDKLTAFDPFDPFDTVHDLGKTTYEGVPAEHYRWSDMILKIIKMQTSDFYADLSNPKAATPLFVTTAITPFGTAKIGTQNHTWSNFTHAPPPAAKFVIAGVDVCPQSNQCGQQAKQTHRLHVRQLHTFARYHAEAI